MLIGEFAKEAGLSQDTVRFYVRKGLLAPQTGSKGGRSPWQIFRPHDVSIARTIRFAQSLGLSLKEISALLADLRSGGTASQEASILDIQIARLEKKAADLVQLLDYLRAKREWIASGRKAEQPSLSSFMLS
ncbi:MerR family transcriptional regulator [Sphingomonas sp. NFR15]|uniref:helix-turn-helix domain-containing protein n=1 Tax=Sphingomonas sp. NFR15 TaxID=1566282 RepID=UPI0008865DB9|nr:MerR family transcriptional regulator [Sphingomonas sp. NFR15]SDA35834.1 DNA-binding transcriptional regulator, MerR family [Sphingomonas sp. NFR15]